MNAKETNLPALQPAALLIIVLCSDGQWRPSPLNTQQAKRVKGFITQEQGGRLKVRAEALTAEEMANLIEPKKENSHESNPQS